MSFSPRRVRLLIRKEFLQLRRDPLLLRVILIMPVLQLVLFGYVVAADVTHISTAIVDLDHTPVSHDLGSTFSSSDYFSVTSQLSDESSIKREMDTSQIVLAIVIPEGTQAALDQGKTAPIGIILDGSDSSTAQVGVGYAQQIIARYNADRGARLGSTTSPPGVDAVVRVLYNPSVKTLNSMLPGLVVVILMLSLMVVMSQAVVGERESGTLEQLFVTPVGRTEYVVGKVAPYALLSCLQATLVAMVSLLWFKVPFVGSVVVALTGLILFLLTSIGLGLLVSLASRTRAQAQQAVLFLGIPMMILSGFIFPIESMPREMTWVSNLIPLTHAITVMRGVAVKGSGFTDLAVPLTALAVFAMVIFGAAIALTRRRLSE